MGGLYKGVCALMQVVKEEKAFKKADADDTVVLKAPKKPGAKTSATLSKETLLRPDDADDEDPGMQERPPTSALRIYLTALAKQQSDAYASCCVVCRCFASDSRKRVLSYG